MHDANPISVLSGDGAPNRFTIDEARTMTPERFWQFLRERDEAESGSATCNEVALLRGPGTAELSAHSDDKSGSGVANDPRVLPEPPKASVHPDLAAAEGVDRQCFAARKGRRRPAAGAIACLAGILLAVQAAALSAWVGGRSPAAPTSEPPFEAAATRAYVSKDAHEFLVTASLAHSPAADTTAAPAPVLPPDLVSQSEAAARPAPSPRGDIAPPDLIVRPTLISRGRERGSDMNKDVAPVETVAALDATQDEEAPRAIGPPKPQWVPPLPVDRTIAAGRRGHQHHAKKHFRRKSRTEPTKIARFWTELAQAAP